VLVSLTVLLLLIGALPLAAQGGGQTLTATVIFDSIQLRQAPDLAAPAVGQALRGETLTLSGRSVDSSWFQVTLDTGETAWLAQYLVQPAGDPAAAGGGSRRFRPPAPRFSFPGCDYFNIGPFHGRSGQSVVLTQGWAAASQALVQEYIDGVLQIVRVNGRLISTYAAYASEIFFDEPSNTWRVFWSFDMGPLATGTYTTEWTQIFDGPISDVWTPTRTASPTPTGLTR
jgi:hypothetical protein